MFAAAADHEASHVVQKHKRNLLLVAVHDEPCGLVGTVVVDDTAHLQFAFFVLHHQALVGDNANRPTVYPGISTEDGFAIVLLKFFHLAVVHHALYDVEHVVRFQVASGEHAIEFFRIF